MIHSLFRRLWIIWNAHAYFRFTFLLAIGRKLLQAIMTASAQIVHSPLTPAKTDRCRLSDEYNIATFASKHNQIDTKLKELKISSYYPKRKQ